MSRRPASSIVASPVLVGAVTVLIAIVAVFLAYNANQGLPFVPTYDVSAELPGGSNLVNGNDVQVGGRRVGLVEKIKPAIDEETGDTIAVIDMKLDKDVEPLPVDTVREGQAALAARPQVRRAHARPERARATRRATRSR